jgi:hypothetical protein
MKMCGTGAGFGRRSALMVMMMALAAAGCGGGGGGGKTANNTADAGGQTASPSTPVNPFTPPSENPPATPAPTPAPTEAPPAATPPAQAPANNRGGVTLAWELPTETSSGAPIGTLSGFLIHYGTDANVLSETIIVDNPGLLTYVVDTLPKGTYYFAVRALTTDGDTSALSNVISKVIS